MATPLMVTIPPLMEEQRISDWEPKFRDSLISLDEMVAIRLPPAYVRRDKLEERVVLNAIEKDTIAKAFTLLKEHLNPVIYIFLAANTFRQSIWPFGEPVHDLFASYLEQGIRVGLKSKCAKLLKREFLGCLV